MNRRGLIAHFGSLRTTLVLIGLCAAVVLAGTVDEGVGGAALALVMALLSANLLAALFVHPAFRRQLPLLVFHLALLALAVLAGVGRLSALDGRFELTQGVTFDGRLIDGQRGALHRERLGDIAFHHDGFDIDYAAGRKRGPTRNRVSWTDEHGRVQSTTIGDHRPLVLEGHRIYTSPNKGFAPMLRWQPTQGEAVLGSVHLPSFPMHELRQSREWQLPDGRAVWVMLQFDEKLIDPAASASFRVPQEHRLVVRVGERRHELAVGERFDLDGGSLVYEGLRTWMGYRITHDPTLPWLLASSLLAAFALCWHFVRKFSAVGLTRGLAGPAGAGAADG